MSEDNITNKDLIPANQVLPAKIPSITINIIRKSVNKHIAGITGILTSDKKELIMEGSQALQKLVNGKGLISAVEVWEKMKKKGKIKNDYEGSEQHVSCLQELLEAFENDKIDVNKFDIIKKIFIVAATESVSTKNDLEPLQYMKIVRSMSSNEILVLLSEYKRYKKLEHHKDKSYIAVMQWKKVIALSSGLKFTSLVEFADEELMKKHLLNTYHGQYKENYSITLTERLTELGFAFCDYISNYEEPF